MASTIRARTVLSVAAAVLTLGSGPASTAGSDPVHTFLAAAFRVTTAEMGHLNAGRVVARTLDARHPREVATLGIVRIRTTPEYYVERLADIASFKQTDDILQIGTFGNPPRLEDVAALTLEEADVRRLRDCRVGDCGVQLPADAIARFNREVDWRAAAVQRQATHLLRTILVEYVGKYIDGGPRAAMEYADKPARLHLGREFASLVDGDAATWQHFPGLRRHLLDYPGGGALRTTDLVYWSKEQVHRRPVISVTHLAIASAGEGWPADYAIASKHIYGMHYFDASLGLTFLLRDPAASSPATYVVYLNRSRIDLFDGLIGGIARRVVTARARSLVGEQLARLRRMLEPQFAASRAH